MLNSNTIKPKEVSAWHLEVEVKANCFGNHVSLFVTEGKIKETALALSRAYPGERVTVSNMSRVRLVCKDGEVVKDNVSLRSFYTGISDDQEWAWKNMFTLYEEVA